MYLLDGLLRAVTAGAWFPHNARALEQQQMENRRRAKGRMARTLLLQQIDSTENAMPFVHISLMKGKPGEHLRAIADGVHEALVESYNAPRKDRFQLIHQYERGEVIYDPNYLGIERTDDIVFIHIVAGNWRDRAAKQALYRNIADRLSARPGLRREDVHVVISSNERDEWSVGNGIASYVQDDELTGSPEPALNCMTY